ncbi:type II toxin-antitoxin system prevent-host-death family antitoxin [Achromobacter insolitus]|uniref:type II toxin-antitoxin system Phd/YefM family antitoxin n=1 Tax=Achromobacter insolitus TaxID=217204 RepID=UPI002FDD2332
MNILTFSEARASFKTVMDNVCKDHDPTVITRVNGEHVVLMSMADYNSMKETLYLLSTEANANRLRKSIANLRAGKAREQELICNESEEEAET